MTFLQLILKITNKIPPSKPNRDYKIRKMAGVNRESHTSYKRVIDKNDSFSWLFVFRRSLL